MLSALGLFVKEPVATYENVRNLSLIKRLARLFYYIFPRHFPLYLLASKDQYVVFDLHDPRHMTSHLQGSVHEAVVTISKHLDTSQFIWIIYLIDHTI